MACTMPRACMDVASGVRIERLRVRTLQQHGAESHEVQSGRLECSCVHGSQRALHLFLAEHRTCRQLCFAGCKNLHNISHLVQPSVQEGSGGRAPGLLPRRRQLQLAAVRGCLQAHSGRMHITISKVRPAHALRLHMLGGYMPAPNTATPVGWVHQLLAALLLADLGCAKGCGVFCTFLAAISRRPSSVTPGHLRTTMRFRCGSGDSSSSEKPTFDT